MIKHFGSLATIIPTVTAALSAHPVMAYALAIGVAVSGLNLLINTLNGLDKSATDSMDKVKKAIDGVSTSLESVRESSNKLSRENLSLESLRAEYVELSTKTEKTADDQARLNELYTKITDLVPGFSTVVANLSDKYSYQSDVIDT